MNLKASESNAAYFDRMSRIEDIEELLLLYFKIENPLNKRRPEVISWSRENSFLYQLLGSGVPSNRRKRHEDPSEPILEQFPDLSELILKNVVQLAHSSGVNVATIQYHPETCVHFCISGAVSLDDLQRYRETLEQNPHP